MKKSKLIHVSFDEVEQFIPRIPEQICPGEDNTTPRICAAPSVIKALQAIPQAGEVIYYMWRIGVPIIIHAYYLESPSVLTPDQIADKVPDALATGETWITEIPESVRRFDYEDALDEEIREYQMDRVALATALKVIANQPTVEMSSAVSGVKQQPESKTTMKKNYELELYKLIMQPDDDGPDISWVDEFGWICGEEFCVWVNLLFFKDFMERFKEIFGSEVFDEGGIHAKIQEDCVCFALEDIMEGYGVELENVFPKDKYKH